MKSPQLTSRFRLPEKPLVAPGGLSWIDVDHETWLAKVPHLVWILYPPRLCPHVFFKVPRVWGIFIYFFWGDFQILKILPYRQLIISLLQRWVMYGLLVIHFLSMCKVAMLQSLAGLYKPMAAIEEMRTRCLYRLASVTISNMRILREKWIGN